MDFALEHVTCLTSSCVNVTGDRSALFPTSETFPSLEALVYGGGFNEFNPVDAALLDQLLTLSYIPGWRNPQSVPTTCLFLIVEALDNYPSTISHLERLAKTSPYLLLYLPDRSQDSVTSDKLDTFSSCLIATPSTSLRLKRLYLPNTFQPSNSTLPHLRSSISTLLAASTSCKITVVFEDVDPDQAGQKVSEHSSSTRRSRGGRGRLSRAPTDGRKREGGDGARREEKRMNSSAGTREEK
jgi:hypothetical protein